MGKTPLSERIAVWMEVEILGRLTPQEQGRTGIQVDI